MYPTVTVKGFSGLIVVFLVVSEVKSFIFQDDGGTDFCARGVDLQEASCNALPKTELAAIRQKALLKEGRTFQNERSREVRQTRMNAERFRSSLGRVRSDEAERLFRRVGNSKHIDNRAEGSFNRRTIRSADRKRSYETERIIRREEGSGRLDNRAIRSFNRETMRSDGRRDHRVSARTSDIRVRRVYVQAERSDQKRAVRDIRDGRSVGSQGEMFERNFAESNGYSINGNIRLSIQRKRDLDTRNERIPTVNSVRISSGHIRQGKRFSRGTPSQRENTLDTRSENLSASRRYTENHERISNKRLSNAGREILGDTARNQESTRRLFDYDKNIGRIRSAVVNMDRRNYAKSEPESRVSSIAARGNSNEKNLRRIVQEPRTTEGSRREGYSIRRIYSSSRSGYVEKIPQSSRQERLRNVESTPEERRTRDSSRSEVNRRSSERLREFGNDRRQRQNFELRKRETNTEYRYRVDSTPSKTTIIARRSRSISSRTRRDVEERRTTKSASTWKREMEESQRNEVGGTRISTSPYKSRETLIRDLKTISQESFNFRRMNIFSERDTENDEARHRLNRINYRRNGVFEVRRYPGRTFDSRTLESFKNLESLNRISREPRSQRMWSSAKKQTEEKLRIVTRTTRRDNRSLRKTNNFEEIRRFRMQQSVVENLRRSDSRKTPLRNLKVVASRDLFKVDGYTTSVPDTQMKRRMASDLFVSIPSGESLGDKAFGDWQGPFQLTLASILVGQLLLFSGDNGKKRCLLGSWMSKVQIF
ncbi:uncharacterized protein LOC123316287 [Coccinella septempunctata]|uniref:uncharacterized protein LOC123316287 n=1 Tax=Coccinella septempunctata TaxID=41139 RepID=UPI001D05D546|nr:uncharacterized protein LOC123316287 [Coccinella septempunctata]